MKKLLTRSSHLPNAILLLAMVCSTLAVSGNPQAQLLDRTLSLNLSNITLEKALQEIETTLKIKFVYSSDQFDAQEKISIEIKDKKLREALDLLLISRHIQYKAHEKLNTITLRKIQKQTEEKNNKSRLTHDNPANTDPKTVTGKVIDKGRQPLPGVNVFVKGTTKGATTDPDGKFELQADENDILVFSFIGFKSLEVVLHNITTLEITLEEEIKGLDEVVVNAGYWKVKEKEQTGNIEKITSEEIAKQPANNVLQSMQGKMAGVYIQQNSGVPGGSYNIQIRGQNSLRNGSLNNGNRPLYIVDGVPFISTPLGTPESGAIIDGGNPLNNINPKDIETIEILKDADATSIYGSRGANGVVLITTKKGQAGKTQFNVNLYHGLGTVNRKMNLLKTQQYLQMRNEAFANDQIAPGTYYPDYDVLNWDQNRYTDWQKTLIGGTSSITNAQLNVSGGNANTRFMITGAYFKESTVFSGDFSDKKISTNFKIGHTSTNDKWKLDFSSYFLVDNNTLPRVDLTPQALTLSPNAPALYNSDKSLNWENSTWTNPVAALYQMLEARTSNLINNAMVRYKIIDGLETKVNLGYSEIHFNEFTSQPKSSFDPAYQIGSSSTFAEKRMNTLILEPQLEYKTKINAGVLTSLAGATIQQNNSDETALSATGFSSDELLRNLQAASSITVSTSRETQYRYAAIFGRINYNWNGKYLLNLTGRKDGSSRFGPNNQFANFGAIGAAWIFTEEKSLNTSWLSFGKFRASYGTTGSDQIGDYGFMDLWNTTRYPYDGTIGLYPANLANASFGWETSKKMEGGIDLGFWEDKLKLTVSYYHNQSGNQLVGIPLPAITGFLSVQANFPAIVENSGLEIHLNTLNVKQKRFSWSSSFNITFPRNNLASFPNIANSSFAYDYIVGKPLSVVPSFHALGVDPATGVYQFKDVNKDGLLTQEDYLGLKSISQDYFGGLQNTLSFKGFSLDIFIQFVKQTGRNYLTYFTVPPGNLGNQPTLVLDRWRKLGDQSPIQQFTQGFGDAYAASQNDTYSDRRISDASFIRLRSISLSYEFQTNWLTKIGLRQLKIDFQGQNLYTFTNYQGLDPENQGAALPPLQRLTMGLQLTF